MNEHLLVNLVAFNYIGSVSNPNHPEHQKCLTELNNLKEMYQKAPDSVPVSPSSPTISIPMPGQNMLIGRNPALDLLNQINENPYLTSRLALKGGTALNLFVFDIPRLSVDIDLNYIGAVELAEMEAERTKLEAEILGICQRTGLTSNEIPSEDHAGGKWRLAYQNALGGTASLELDLNFMYRLNFRQFRTALFMDSGLLKAA